MGEIVLGTVTAKLSMRLGEDVIESVNRQSVKEMVLKVDGTMTALINFTEATIMAE